MVAALLVAAMVVAITGLGVAWRVLGCQGVKSGADGGCQGIKSGVDGGCQGIKSGADGAIR